MSQTPIVPRQIMAGFTLIELMISLVLGLLISAAVIQVYVISTRTATVQQSASEVQDSSIFALQSIEDNVRLANMGNPITSITDKTAHGGIVLTNTNLGTANTATNATATTLLTNSTGSTGFTGVSNIISVGSDQLTLQYKNITPNPLYDCEGAEITAGSSDWVIERYFVRLATGASDSATTKDLVLACAAGRADADGMITTAFTGNGEVVIAAVDQFKVLLGVQTDVSQLTYISPKTYLELTEAPPITTVKLGVIIRSTTPLLTDADKDTFSVLGSTQTLKIDTTRTKYYRRSYETTILLRNARVMNVIATKPKLVSS